MSEINRLAVKLNIENQLERFELDRRQIILEDACVKKAISLKANLSKEELDRISKATDLSYYDLVNPSVISKYKQFLNESPNLYSKYDTTGKELITTKGKDLIESLEDEGIKSTVYNVLCGGNVRDVTEFITRNRLLVSNGSLFKLISDLSMGNNSILTEEYHKFLVSELAISNNNNERMIPLWLLGLTKKGVDNIVRGQDYAYDYVEKLTVTIEESLDVMTEKFGELDGQIFIGDQKVKVNWHFMIALFNAIGAQTLSVRGSSKSMSGKFFEKLILGTTLTMMGFEFKEKTPTDIKPEDKLFILSSVEDDEREIDATVIHNGKAVSIDIGFIGKGNPEISSDKLTRFKTYKNIGRLEHVMKTIVIIDTMGNNSHLTSIAEDIDGTAIEMKSYNWVKTFAQGLSNNLETDCIIESIPDNEIHEWMKIQLEEIDLSTFL